MVNKREIEEILKNYHWMLNSIKLEREALKQIGGNLSAKYGIEASLPKAHGQSGDRYFKKLFDVVNVGRRLNVMKEKLKLFKTV